MPVAIRTRGDGRRDADVLAAAGLPHESIESDDRAARGPTPLEAELSVERGQRTTRLRNVVGGVEGSRDVGAIVLGAHYDHLGRGSSSSLARDDERGAIHPGADDNASGVAVAIAVACRIAEAPLERQVIVALFAGEEIGLLGSAHYVAHPAAAIDDTIAMINLDMVGRLRRDRAVVFGSGSAREFPALLRRVAGATGLRLGWQSDGIGPSDHTSFFLAKRPVLHFFTGVHDDYHRPSDRAERLNANGMAKIAAAVLGTMRSSPGNRSRPPSSRRRARARRRPAGMAPTSARCRTSDVRAAACAWQRCARQVPRKRWGYAPATSS